MRRSIVAGLAAVGLLTSPVLAAEAPPGRGSKAQARMDAATAPSGSRPVQILNELCGNPSGLRRCAPISSTLQRALEQAIDRPITWVAHRDVNGPQFWVFAPIAYDSVGATSESAWWDPGTFGCRGGTQYDWERRSGAWSTVSGIGWAACVAP